MRDNGIKLRGYNLDKGRLRDVIAAMLKMSKTKIGQLETVNHNLIPEFHKALEENSITFSAAYELAGMSEEGQREALEKYAEDGKLSHKTIKEMKKEKADSQGEQIPGQMSFDQDGNITGMESTRI